MSVGAGLLLSGPGAPAELQGGTDDDEGLDIDHSLDDDDERLMDSLISSPTGHAVGLPLTYTAFRSLLSLATVGDSNFELCKQF